MAKKLTIGKLASELLSNLSPRQKEVMEGRFGLKSKDKKTLAEIGESYGVTRERIRQIEALALNSLKNKLQNHKEAGEFVAFVTNYLTKFGGVRREDSLASDFLGIDFASATDKYFANKLNFLMEVSDKFQYHQSDTNFNSFWYLNDDARQKAESFINKLSETLVANGDWKAEMKTAFAENYLSLSKKFAHNGYGDFGLAEWPHINPKTARDWAFLVLKKTQKPMHFSQLAKFINTLRKGRVTNVQTVHNELIKDDRFVLVGRGIYGLKEFNLVAGTCREVIAKILKENGPQTSKNIIQLVIAKRDFKENTLVLNLQNKKHFTRLSDGRYTLREV